MGGVDALDGWKQRASLLQAAAKPDFCEASTKLSGVAAHCRQRVRNDYGALLPAVRSFRILGFRGLKVQDPGFRAQVTLSSAHAALLDLPSPWTQKHFHLCLEDGPVDDQTTVCLQALRTIM